MTVAILGLGNMGMGMARRLLAAGYAVNAWNRSRVKAEALAAEGATEAATPKDATAGAGIVIAMLSDDEASRSTWLGADGALAGVSPGTILIESSTLSLTWVTELANLANTRECPLLDAPVTGSKAQADAGELLFLIGGDADVVEQARAVFQCMGRGLVHFGPNGCGIRMKLVNNFLGAVQAASLAEALALIERTSLDPAKVLDVLTNGAPGSPMVRTMAPRMAGRDYEPRFALRWMTKDLRYVLEEAAAVGVTLRFAETALGLFQDAVSEGWADQDLSAVVEPLRSNGQAGGR